MGKLLSYHHVSISWETLTLDNDLKKILYALGNLDWITREIHNRKYLNNINDVQID
jgi:hypothetical protein